MRLGPRFVLVASVAICVLFLFHIFRSTGVKKVNTPSLKLFDRRINPDVCFYDHSCAAPKLLFRIQGEHSNIHPFACLNDIRLFRESLEDGLHFASLHGTTGDILETQAFDLSDTTPAVNWLNSLPEATMIIGISTGDIAHKVTSNLVTTLALYGATKVKEWQKGHSYTLVGQRGLKKAAHEQIIPITSTTEEVLQGCFDIPLGDLFTENITKIRIERIYKVSGKDLSGLSQMYTNVTLGDVSENCGMSKKCGTDEVAIHLFSGEHKDDFPRICVGDRMIFDKDLNDAGRGLNILSLDSRTGIVRTAAHFDTYEDGSSALEEFLDTIPTGDIVAAVSFDEASNMLSDMARNILYEMGSSMIHRLKFRASWYFIGQKGISAYTPFEDLNVPTGNNWAKPVRVWICLPLKLKKWTGFNNQKSLVKRAKNVAKRHFCAKHDHINFCAEHEIDIPILPPEIFLSKNLDHPMFNIPILIVAGLSTSSLLDTLQSLVIQQHLNLDMVILAYDKEYLENAHVASLFHLKALSFNGSSGYNDMVISAIDETLTLFPASPAVVVITEDVILSKDWLSYLSQLITVFEKDSKIDVVNTFNPNGFFNTSSRASVVYRTSQSPSYSYILSKACFESKIRNNPACCTSQNEWDLNVAAITPELSRVTVVKPPSVNPVTWELPVLFSRKRISSGSEVNIDSAILSEDSYDLSLVSLIKRASVVTFSNISCENWKSSKFKSSVLVILLEDANDFEHVAACFGLAYHKVYLNNWYKGTIRFSMKTIGDILIVTKNSHFYNSLKLIIT